LQTTAKESGSHGAVHAAQRPSHALTTTEHAHAAQCIAQHGRDTRVGWRTASAAVPGWCVGAGGGAGVPGAGGVSESGTGTAVTCTAGVAGGVQVRCQYQWHHWRHVSTLCHSAACTKEPQPNSGCHQRRRRRHRRRRQALALHAPHTHIGSSQHRRMGPYSWAIASSRAKTYGSGDTRTFCCHPSGFARLCQSEDHDGETSACEWMLSLYSHFPLFFSIMTH
jgi:hypothetical protein